MIGRSRNGKECKATTNQIDVENETSVKKVKTVINAEDTKTFCDEFSEELEYIYFGDTGDESNDSETSDIDFVIKNFNGQIIVRSDDYQKLSYASVSKMSKAYLEPAEAFKMELYAETVNGINLLTLSAKKFHLKCLTRF